MLGAAVVVGRMRRAPLPAAAVAGALANANASEPAAAEAKQPLSSPPPAAVSARPIVGGERSRLRRQLVASLDDLRSRVGACSSHEGAGRSIQHGQRAQETVLTLEVEVLHGRMQVVDAAVQTQGSASGAFVSCAQRSLRGQIVRAPAAKAGGRMRMPLRLGFRTGTAPE
jgi:hypothetical protein